MTTIDLGEVAARSIMEDDSSNIKMQSGIEMKNRKFSASWQNV